MRTGQSGGCSGQLADLPSSMQRSQPGVPVHKASDFFFFFSDSLRMFWVATHKSSPKILEEILMTWKIAGADIFAPLSIKPPSDSHRIHKFEEPLSLIAETSCSSLLKSTL